MNTIREIQKINELELERGIAGTSGSWHDTYRQSAWIYVGNLDHSLTEGDILCVLSQFGELEDISLVRDEETGDSRGFCFAKYEDARSCVLAVDNFCGIQLCGRSLRVDHVENYRLPKALMENEEALTNNLRPGHAYQDQVLENDYNLQKGQDLFAKPAPPAKTDRHSDNDSEAKRQRKLEREQKREEKEQRHRQKERKREQREERRRGKRAVEYNGKEHTSNPSVSELNDGTRRSRKRKNEKKSLPDES